MVWPDLTWPTHRPRPTFAPARCVPTTSAPVQLVVNVLCVPRQVLAVLDPFEVRHNDAAAIGVDVGQHGDAAPPQHGVSLRRHGHVCGLYDRLHGKGNAGRGAAGQDAVSDVVAGCHKFTTPAEQGGRDNGYCTAWHECGGGEHSSPIPFAKGWREEREGVTLLTLLTRLADDRDHACTNMFHTGDPSTASHRTTPQPAQRLGASPPHRLIRPTLQLTRSAVLASSVLATAAGTSTSHGSSRKLLSLETAGAGQQAACGTRRQPGRGMKRHV